MGRRPHPHPPYALQQLDAFEKMYGHHLSDLPLEGTIEAEAIVNNFPIPNRPHIRKMIPFLQQMLEEEISSSFPLRTAVMAQTLSLLEQYRLTRGFSGKVILIAGKHHLIQQIDETDPRFLLHPLYAELAKIPAQIIVPR